MVIYLVLELIPLYPAFLGIRYLARNPVSFAGYPAGHVPDIRQIKLKIMTGLFISSRPSICYRKTNRANHGDLSENPES